MLYIVLWLFLFVVAFTPYVYYGWIVLGVLLWCVIVGSVSRVGYVIFGWLFVMW